MATTIEKDTRTFKIISPEGSTGFEVREGGKLLATGYLTQHPTIPYEVFLKGPMRTKGPTSKRVNTIEELIDFVIQNPPEQ